MKQTIGEKIFNVFNILIMILLCVITLYPYLNQLAVALNEGMDTMAGGITIFPRKFTLANFEAVITNDNFLVAAWISVSKVLLNLVFSLAVTFCAAFALTRKGLPAKRGFTLFLMISSYISAGVIPTYILYRYLGLIDNYWVYIFPTVFSFYNMVVIRSFIQEIPESIDESALIDGANEFQIMTRITVPLSLPVLATVALWVAVWSWNDYNTTLMYVTNKNLFSLQYLMMQIIKESELVRQMAVQSAMGNHNASMQPTPDSIKAATLIVTTIPIILVYPFLQRFFIKGITVGAVKG